MRFSGIPLIIYGLTSLGVALFLWFLVFPAIFSPHSTRKEDEASHERPSPQNCNSTHRSVFAARPFSSLISVGTNGTAIKLERLAWLQDQLGQSTHFLLNNYTLPLDYFSAKLNQLGRTDIQLQLHDTGVTRTCLEETILHPEQDRLNATVLASFPRSGNSWLRALIEMTSGYGTSSMYCDRLLVPIFRWECERSNRYLMKLHYPHKFDTLKRLEESESHWIRWQKYDQCLYLVRNPFDAFLSYFMFKTARGRHDLKQSNFPKNFFDVHHIKRMTMRYKTHWTYWKLDSRLPNLVIRYEDLKSEPFSVLLKSYLLLLPNPLETELGMDGESEDDFRDMNLTGSFDRISLLGMYHRLSCAIQDDLEHKGTVYATQKYDIGHSLSYFKPEAIAFIRTELAGPMAQFNY